MKIFQIANFSHLPPVSLTPRVHSHAPSIWSHRGTKVAWPDFQPMKVPEEPVCFHLFRQNPVFTSLHLKSPVHVVPPQKANLTWTCVHFPDLFPFEVSVSNFYVCCYSRYLSRWYRICVCSMFSMYPVQYVPPSTVQSEGPEHKTYNCIRESILQAVQDRNRGQNPFNLFFPSSHMDTEAFKGIVPRDFRLHVFISFPQAPKYTLGVVSNFCSKCTTCVIDTGGKWKKSAIRKVLIILFWHLEWILELTCRQILSFKFTLRCQQSDNVPIICHWYQKHQRYRCMAKFAAGGAPWLANISANFRKNWNDYTVPLKRQGYQMNIKILHAYMKILTTWCNSRNPLQMLWSSDFDHAPLVKVSI